MAQVRTGGAERRVRRLREDRLSFTHADAEDTLPQLRNPEVRSVDLAKLDAISGLDDRIEEIDDAITALGRQEAFDVLEDERPRPELCDGHGERRDQRVAMVACTTGTR
jgi:hypothetical protein